MRNLLLILGLVIYTHKSVVGSPDIDAREYSKLMNEYLDSTLKRNIDAKANMEQSSRLLTSLSPDVDLTAGMVRFHKAFMSYLRLMNNPTCESEEFDILMDLEILRDAKFYSYPFDNRTKRIIDNVIVEHAKACRRRLIQKVSHYIDQIGALDKSSCDD